MRLPSLSLARRNGQNVWKANVCLIRKRHKHTHIQHAHMHKDFGRESLLTAAEKLHGVGPMRTRFAPSPTGTLHLGSLRTALFNYLLAKATGGSFILRIEDTDTDRTVAGAEDLVIRDLLWAGLNWDEGPATGGKLGPYRQSERKDLYEKYAQKLLKTGDGYRCFCSKKRLHDLARHQSILGNHQSYDRTCANIPAEQSDQWAADGKPYVIRLRIPGEGYPPFKDENFGIIKPRLTIASTGGFEDPIMVKTDGMPTYHFANVVDDHLMKITHVIRGSEWMSSTAKHILLYKAFGWTPPKFAHVGLLLNKDRAKLSKRDGAVDIGTFKDLGYFPESLTNFAALLGWSHPYNSDVMDMNALIRYATMKYTKGDTVVAFEKLDFLQKKHAARYAWKLQNNRNPDANQDLRMLAARPILDLINSSQDQKYEFYNCSKSDEAKSRYITQILLLDAERYTLPPDFLARNRYFFTAPKASDLEKNMFSLRLRGVPAGVIFATPDDFADSFDAISSITDKMWERSELKSVVDLLISQGTMLTTAEYTQNQEWTEGGQLAIKKGWMTLIHRYLRWALLAGDSGLQGVDTMLILGKQETARRLNVAKKVMEKNKLEQKKEAAEGTGANVLSA